MSPKVSVFLPSYNKGEYVLDAMRSVFAQTTDDWELWLLENSNDGVTDGVVRNELSKLDAETRFKVHYERLEGEDVEKTRRTKYMTSWLLNTYYPRANGKYIFYLSDDDTIDPECLRTMAGMLDINPSWKVCFAGLRHVTPDGPGDNGPWPDVGIAAVSPKIFAGSVDCRIDGGQIMHHASCLDNITQPYFEESNYGPQARHVDGVFMERLVKLYRFHPVPYFLINHRWTNLSVWSPIE